MTSTNANTMPVVCMVSLRVGHTTFLVSRTDSLAKAKKSLPGSGSPGSADRNHADQRQCQRAHQRRC